MNSARGRSEWSWRVSVYNESPSESTEFVVHARHRAEAKQRAAPHIDFKPRWWYVRPHDPVGDKEMREEMDEITSDIEEAIVLGLTVALLAFFTAPLWKPALWLRDKLTA